jgi:hypothetical protein
MAHAMANLPCFAGELAAPRHGNPRFEKFASQAPDGAPWKAADL